MLACRHASYAQGNAEIAKSVDEEIVSGLRGMRGAVSVVHLAGWEGVGLGNGQHGVSISRVREVESMGEFGGSDKSALSHGLALMGVAMDILDRAGALDGQAVIVHETTASDVNEALEALEQEKLFRKVLQDGWVEGV